MDMDINEDFDYCLVEHLIEKQHEGSLELVKTWDKKNKQTRKFYRHPNAPLKNMPFWTEGLNSKR